jgi:hypothetical protein
MSVQATDQQFSRPQAIAVIAVVLTDWQFKKNMHIKENISFWRQIGHMIGMALVFIIIAVCSHLWMAELACKVRPRAQSVYVSQSALKGPGEPCWTRGTGLWMVAKATHFRLRVLC